jgi:hypothetical protein
MTHRSEIPAVEDRGRVNRMYSTVRMLSDHLPHHMWPESLGKLLGWRTYEAVPWWQIRDWEEEVLGALGELDRRKSEGEVVYPEVEITICCLPLIRQTGLVSSLNSIDSLGVSWIERAIRRSQGHWSRPYLGVLLYEYALELCRSEQRMDCTDPFRALIPIEALLCDTSNRLGFERSSPQVESHGQTLRSLDDLRVFAEHRGNFLDQRSAQFHTFMTDAFLQRQVGPRS